MQRFYRDLENFVRTKYPHFRGKISGDVYPPAFHAVVLANIASSLWMGGLIAVFGGSAICQAIGVPEPQLLRSIQGNKMMFLGGLFVLNNMANGMLATGAFEVYFGDELVFSKLTSNRFPSAQDIIQQFSMHGLLPADMDSLQ
jgi:selT/selW/selH-like putative selenoprotein